MEYAGSPFDIKSLDDAGHIEGLLAGFNNVDRGGDKLLPGVFAKTLAARITPLPMLLHHDLNRPIGAWKEWSERPDGLYVKGRLTLSTRDAQEAHALVKDGALTGLSIGWKSAKDQIDQASGVRVIAEAELFEGSLVTVPMNNRTRVSAIKSIAGARDIAELLQEAGVSGRKAKVAAGAAWRALNTEPDIVESKLADILEQASASLSRFQKG